MAAFMCGIAILMFVLQLTSEGTDRSGDWIVGIAALVVASFGIFASFALIAVVRIYVALSATMLDAMVVCGHTWFLAPRFRAIHLPLNEIASVESRQEIFRTIGITTMRDALSINTVGGERIGLFSNTLGSVSTLPIDDVAGALATAAGIAVTDDGTVVTKGWGAGLYGAASSSWAEHPLDTQAAARAQHRALLTAQICTGLLVISVLLRMVFAH